MRRVGEGEREQERGKRKWRRGVIPGLVKGVGEGELVSDPTTLTMAYG